MLFYRRGIISIKNGGIKRLGKNIIRKEIIDYYFLIN